MDTKAKKILIYFTIVVVCLFFLFWGLSKAKPFLAPLSVAALLAMVVLPIARWFEGKGLKRGWASLFSDLIILIFFLALAGVVGAQVKSLVEDWPQIKKRVKPKIEKIQEQVANRTGISVEEQNKNISENIPGSSSEQSQNKGQEPAQPQQGEGQNQQKDPKPSGSDSGGESSGETGGSMISSAGTFISTLFSSLGTFLLILVYIFFFLLYRKKFKNSILKFVPDEKKAKARSIISKSADISQSYLFGRLLLILILAILYSIGLSISGVKHAILISILAAVLSLIPYIGNIIGFFLAIAMAFISGSGAMGAVGVAITFAIAQFVESYILEPYIVGDKVDLNPVFTILVVVLGGSIWGVIGMIIAIPALGIIKVICDHIPVLNPLGYMFGEEDIGDEENKDNFFKKTKRWALNKFQS